MVKLTFWSHQKSDDVASDIQNHVQRLRRNSSNTSTHNDVDGDIDDNVDGNIELWFSQTIFDQQVAAALKELFSYLSQARLQIVEPGTLSTKNNIFISRMQLDRCEGNEYTDESIKAALDFDVVEVLCVDGQVGSYDLLKSFPLAMSNSHSNTNIQEDQKPRYPIHLRELDLRYFEISSQDIVNLRNGILNPALRQAGGGLERLSCCNVKFQDDQAVQEFAKTLSELSQKQQGSKYENENETGRFLETLWLYYCNIEDQQLETIMRSLMTVNIATDPVQQTRLKIPAASKDYEDWPLDNIGEPLDTDVACGKGYSHFGNIVFGKLVMKYFKAECDGQEQASKKILEKWRRQSPPGRFLKCNKTTGTWYDVGDEAAEVRIEVELKKLRKNVQNGAFQIPKRTKDETKKENTTKTLTGNASPVVVESTLKSLTIEQARCGSSFYALLGAWLLNCETPLMSETLRSSCSLETVNIYIWEATQTRASIDPIHSFTQSLEWRNIDNENENENETNSSEDDRTNANGETKNEIATNNVSQRSYRKTINRNLKKLCLSGVDDMGILGRLLSEHFLALESLRLHSHGPSDEGMNSTKFSNFVSASLRNKNILNRTIKNFVLRELSFHCMEKTTRLALESSSALEGLLDRYPSLCDVKFGFKRNAFQNNKKDSDVDTTQNDMVQHRMNTNAAGRFLFFPTANRHSIAFWPTVLVEFHKRKRAELDSLMDEDLQRWVESGSVGGDGSDSESEPESDDEDDSDDEDEENPETPTTTNPPIKSEDPRVMEQTASAIFSLLKPNMERILLLGSSKPKRPSRTSVRKVTVETKWPPIRHFVVVNQLADEANSMHIMDDETFPRKRAGEMSTSSPRKFRREVSNDATMNDNELIHSITSSRRRFSNSNNS